MKRFIILPLAILALSGCGRKSIDEQFAENARQETQQMCPRKIDECTTLDSIVYDMTTRTQNHYYTFSGNMDDPSIFTPNFLADIRESMLKSLCNEIKLKKQMEASINFGYVYHSASTGKPLLKILFTPNDYNSPITSRSFNERITGKWNDYTQRFCPEEQDANTILQSVKFDSTERKIFYVYEISGELDIDSFDIVYPEASKHIKRLLTKGLKENESMKEEKDSLTDFNIRYVSKNTGRTLMDIEIKGTELKQ